MSAEVQVSQTTEGPRALLAYLRDHPEGRFQRPDELSARFRVSLEFVATVLEKSEPQVKPHSDQAQKYYNQIFQLRKQFRNLRDRAARHPTTFVITSTLFAELVLLLISLATGKPAINLDIHGNIWDVISAGAVIPLIAVCLHMSLFFRRAMMRFALYGALAYFILGAIPLTLLQWSATKLQPQSDRVLLCLVVIFAHFLVSSLYAVVGITCSYLGEFRRILRENRRVERMTRQELLERLFQLQARMEAARSGPEKPVRFAKITTFFRGRLLLSAVVCGFVLRIIANRTVGAHLQEFFEIKNGMIPQVIPLMLGITMSLLNWATIALLSYIAPTLGTALSVGLVYAFGELIAQALSIPPGPKNSFIFLSFLVGTLFIPVFSLILSAIAGFGAKIQTKKLEELNLQRNDEASLIAEQLKIQWRLAENSCSTTVMVVDVVKSTQMKEGADPLAVEYSFRRFQQWIEDISATHGGTVTSTAGDGAVIAFSACHNAFLAATEIQRRMPTFNQSWNKLGTRFRVRIGLHSGEVQGDIGKVQFAQVIDIAAHMQKLAPAGGVAATSEVVTTLGPSAFVPLAIKSDGHDVFLALSPSGL